METAADPNLILAVLLAAFFVLCLLAAILGIRAAISEQSRPSKSPLAAAKHKPNIAAVKRKGPGLRFKLTSLIMVLVLFVIIAVSASFYFLISENRQEALLKDLLDRTALLLDGLSIGVKAYLPSGNIPELSLLAGQAATMPETRYVTITGISSRSQIYEDIVWATTDPDILSKIDTPYLRPGVSRISDAVSPCLENLRSNLNGEADKKIGLLSERINELTLDAVLLTQNRNSYGFSELENIELSMRSAEASIAGTLSELTRQLYSEPPYNFSRIPQGSRNFIFYKPVMYRHGPGNNYFRGLVRLEVSIESIAKQIQHDRGALLHTVLAIIICALAAGSIGSLIISSLAMNPVRKLARHAGLIRETKDTKSLGEMNIHMAGCDEAAMLGETINDMTRRLAKAAAAASDLSLGREIQKRFLPLDTDNNGDKHNYGHKNARYAAFFGYYEGARGISGDYFDFRDLDGRFFSVMKCDVAGKGIPAALIMIQVATMYLNYFNAWKWPEKGTRIEELVYQINGFIETMGFKERFAAFTLCLFDSKTGNLHFCNAGDNIINIYDYSDRCLKSVALPETPAAGIMPNKEVEARGGYSVQTLKLDRGDILLLCTDGIEESKRKFRDMDFNEIVSTASHDGLPAGNESMGSQRVQDIINAVMNRQTYQLHKWHNPEGNYDLSFDFSSCRGGVEDLILALIAVEKMFRCYRNKKIPQSGKAVLVDKKVDAFLKAHFLQYKSHCANAHEYAGNNMYMCYTYLKEDELYDDLTILGIKRK